MSINYDSIINATDKEMQKLKHKQLRIIVIIMACILIIPLLIIYITTIKNRADFFMPAIHTITYIIILLGVLPSKYLSFSVKRVMLLTGLLISSFTSLVLVGNFGSAYLLFLLCVLCAQYFISKKVALVLIISILVVLVIFIVLRSSGYLNIMLTNIEKRYLITIINKIIIYGVILVIIYSFHNSALDKLKESIIDGFKSRSKLITEQKTTKDYLELLPGSIFLFNDIWNLIRWNSKTKTMTGYSDNELHQRNALSFFELENQGSIRSSISEVFSKGETFTECELLKKDGSTIPIALFGKMMTIDNSNCCCIIATDISEKKNLERELLESQKMEALGMLSGGIAHDLNNILGGIIGYAEIIKDDIAEKIEIDPNYINSILSAGERAEGIVNQILLFSRKSEVQKLPIKIYPIIKDAVNLIRHTIPKSIEIREEYKNTNDTVFADVNQIHQIVMNICTNAWHAMKEDGGFITIKLKTENISENDIPNNYSSQPGKYQMIEISDTGKGIPEHIVEKVFDPFFTTKAKGEGTGLGLAVVNKIIKNHNGFIKINSKPGKGTGFSVFLPNINQESEMIKDTDIKDLPSGSETILIVDDEPQIRDVAEIILKKLGYKVYTAENGKDGEEIFTKNLDTIDIVITDYSMPKMAGVHMVVNIKKLNPQIPAILITGYSRFNKNGNSEQHLFVATLDKPLKKEVLAFTVRNVLDGKNKI